MNGSMRQIVRYNNRKLYEPRERRFVTLDDLARTVASGGRVQVKAAPSGEDITARVLSRALASDRGSVSASADALTRLFRAGSEAAGTVADVVERVGGSTVAATMRKAATPERLAETFAPVTRRLEDARQEVERIFGGLVGRGRLTWEEATSLKDEVGTVFRESLSDVLIRVRHLTARVKPTAPAELAIEIENLNVRLDQLEALTAKTFPIATAPAPERAAASATKKAKRAAAKNAKKTTRRSR